MSKLLIVDDEEMIRMLIKKYAEFEGYEVFEAKNGLECIEMVRNNDYDVIIMDVMMPELDGFSAAKEIRKIKNIPIIILSARGEEYDRIHGFEMGVDDYVVKPFSPKELMLRVGAVLRRSVAKEPKRDVLEFEGLSIDLLSRKVYVDGAKVDLSPKEYEILVFLAKNKNIAISRERFISEIWGYDYDGFDRTLDTHIKMLRKNLGVYSKFIGTVRSVGYIFEV
ncbi:MAG: response regulator transcription factor [Clostridia bacterium]|jgi:two-component system response regulator ResD|nr:response regulator transcription factor [Clostridia bacterium]MCX4367319.1 response regulator transcription factor [Clostridia bacterium]